MQHGEDADEDFQRVQVEGKSPAIDQGSAFGIKTVAEVKGSFDAGLASETGLGVGGGTKDVVASFVGARRPCSFGEDGRGEGRRGGGETEELD